MSLPPDIVDLNRYPLCDLVQGRSSSFITTCRHQLATTGICLLPGFIKDSAVESMQQEAQALTANAHYTEHFRATPNGADNAPVSTLAKPTRASMRCVAYDHLDQTSLVRRLYESPGMTALVNRVFDSTECDSSKLYPTTDPTVSCMLTILKNADELGWHYDPNDGVVSLLIQEADTGGEFEYAFDIRAPKPDAMAAEQAVLDNAYPETVSTALAPGTLSLFNGHRTLHRVAPVHGDRARIIALFNYAGTENYHFDDAIKHRFFGRENLEKQA